MEPKLRTNKEEKIIKKIHSSLTKLSFQNYSSGIAWTLQYIGERYRTYEISCKEKNIIAIYTTYKTNVYIILNQYEFHINHTEHEK